MKIKVCGMKHPRNIIELTALPIDFIGFIFYPKSPRYTANLDIETMKQIPKRIKKIGVFVNEAFEAIIAIAEKYNLDGIQLHGNENPELCRQVKNYGLFCIKAFSVSEKQDLAKTAEYESVIDYFLFDTKTTVYGGSGKKFDWLILDDYSSKIPFLLSGGIDIDDMKRIKTITHPQFTGIDINSRFESDAELKDIEKINKLTTSLLRILNF